MQTNIIELVAATTATSDSVRQRCAASDPTNETGPSASASEKDIQKASQDTNNSSTPSDMTLLESGAENPAVALSAHVCWHNNRPVRAVRVRMGGVLWSVCDARPPRPSQQNVFGKGFAPDNRRAAVRQRHSRSWIYLTRLFDKASRAGRQRGIGVRMHRDDVAQLWIQQQGRCALSGVPMSHTLSRSVPDAQWRNASLDRIDSNQGYEPGNLQLVCALVNRMKSNLPQSDFVWWCAQIAHRALVTGPEATLADPEDEARMRRAREIELDDALFQ